MVLENSRCWVAAALLATAVGCAPAPSDADPPGDSPVGGELSRSSSPGSVSGEDVFVRATAHRFRDVAAPLGVVFDFFSDATPDRFFLPEIMGGGVAWFDFDRDGRMDLYAANGAVLAGAEVPDDIPRGPKPALAPTNALWRNLGREFEPCATPSGSADLGYGQGVAVADYDADGFDDLFIANFGVNRLLRNNGDGTFSDVTEEAGLVDSLWGSSCVWLDIDGDDDNDLYVCNYLDVGFDNWKICKFGGAPGYCGPGEYDAQPDRVYLNQGDGRFVESASELGLLGLNGKGLAICAADLDQDLRPEIYVANDMTPNFLFTRTESTERMYRETAAPSGCATSDVGQNEASMGVACADFDGDGAMDLFLTHFFSYKNTLYRNLGGLLFRDDSKRSRIAATSYQTLGFGTIAADFDGDGDNDLFIANGHVLGPNTEPNVMRPQLLLNDGTGRFDDASSVSGDYFLRKYLGRGAAACDFDDDGRLDIAVSHVGQPLALLRNESFVAEQAFIGFELATPARTIPVGARITVRAGGETRYASVFAGGSYLSTSDPRVLVRLVDDAEVVDIEIVWPSGVATRYDALPRGRYYRVYQDGRVHERGRWK